ncbi:DUF421 domain-containing protein [Cupriavidus gilardii]|uniref:DUF421 domain-containing protein n=1 Tax=Cupriavidus gilardii TaxID=82541 RepID=UPI0007E3F585|nr:YetF domain-containing protein [Cupriavidus gilardii]MCT9117139.1 DUF421 domain-containing protein [Cupriavidus gilardii]
MWELNAPWWEFVVRGLIIYFALLVLMRLGGKRQIGQMTPFDLVLLLILSEGVQNAMVGDDKSVSGGLILAVTLIGGNLLVSWLSWRSRGIEYAVEGKPQLLIRDGKVFQDVMKGARITSDDLMKVLRRENCNSLDDVHVAILENDGAISVLKHKDRPEKPPGPGVSLWQRPEDDKPV